MFWSLVSLLVLALIVRGITRLVRAFFIWLGRGKPLKRAIENRAVPEDVVEATDAIIMYRTARSITKQTKRHMHLTWKQVGLVIKAELTLRDDYVDHCKLTWYSVVIIFLVCSVAGLVLEEVWMYISAGLTQGRYGLVWGPFSPLYGFGGVFLTGCGLAMWHRHAKWWQVFLVSMVIGGVLEQVTGWSMETLMGAVSWDYIAGGVPGAITKWVAVPFLFAWGLIGLIWTSIIMPWTLYIIGEPTTKRQVIFVALLLAYLLADIEMTLVCFNRRTARDQGIPPANAFEEWVDTNYSDQFMSQRFENMVIEGGNSEDAAA